MARKEKLIEKAQKFIQKGYLDKAIAEYRSAQQLDSNDVSIRLRLGDLYVKTDRKEEAIKEYTDAAKSNSQRGFYLKAIAVYKQILKLNDSDLDVHYRLADLYTKQRLNADAISEYSHIVNALELFGKVDEALVIVNKMVDIDSENTGIRLRLAEIYQKKGFDEDALAEYSNVFDKLVEDGKLDRAEKIYVHLHESYPDNVEVLERLADLFKLKGDSDRYLAYSRILMRRHEKAGDSERLRAVCEAILDENPEDEDAKRIMGEIAPSAPDKPRDKGETPAEAVEAAGDVAEEPSAEAAADVAEEAVVEVASSDAERLAGDEGGAGEAPEEIVISLDGFDEKEEASEAAWEAPSGEDPAGEIAAATSAEEAAAEEVAAGGDEDDLVDIEVPGIEEGLAGAMAEADGPEEVPEEEAGSAAAPEAADDVAADVAAEATAQEAAEDVAEGVSGDIALPEAAESAGDMAEEPAAAVDVEVPDEMETAFAEALEAVERAGEEAAEEVEVPGVTELEEEGHGAGEDEVANEGADATGIVDVDAAVEAAGDIAEEVAGKTAVPEAAGDVAEEVAAEATAQEAAEDVAEDVSGDIALPEAAESAGDMAEEPAVAADAEVPDEMETAFAESLDAVERAGEEAAEEVEVPGVTELEEDVYVAGEATVPEASDDIAEDVSEEAVAPEAADDVAGEATVPEASDDIAEDVSEEAVAPEAAADGAEDIAASEAIGDIVDEEVPVESASDRAERVPEEDAGDGYPEETDEDLAEAVEELMEKIEPEEHMLEHYPGTVAAESAEAAGTTEERGEDYVDLTAELGMADALETLTENWEGTESAETLAEFRNGMGRQLSREDTETHYNLGIAYMEMELHEEAANEFKIAIKDPRLEFDCYNRLGHCSSEAGFSGDAITYYRKALDVKGRSEEEKNGVRYELALVHEATGNTAEAAALFMDVYEKDPSYRDVAEKVAAWQASRPSVPLDDGMIEVELL